MDMISYPIMELNQLALAPVQLCSDFTRLIFKHPLNPLAHTQFGRSVVASSELFGRMTRRRAKPAFGLTTTIVDGETVDVGEEIMWRRPFCQLLHFKRDVGPKLGRQPRLLIVAPMSGHFATLLRGTVEAFLPTHDVFITDWADARLVPADAGRFDLDDYIDYVIAMCESLGRSGGLPVHVLAVCQPTVPVLAAVARMEAEKNRHVPASMTLIGGPVDTRRGATALNSFASRQGLEWFRKCCVHVVPFSYPGAGRAVCPGFMQLCGFMSMNFDRHVKACYDTFNHLCEGDGDAAEKHRRFYDEYLAVMDLTAEFYLQTIETVFMRHSLPRGEMTHRGQKITPSSIRRVALMTIEGEKDDITGVGQTEAAHGLCVNIPSALRARHLQKDAGHYGIFNGSRFRAEIAPRICAFHARVERLAVKAHADQPIAARRVNSSGRAAQTGRAPHARLVAA